MAEHRQIIGIRVDVTDYAGAAGRIAGWADQGQSRYVCVCNVHMIMEAHDDLRFLQVVNEADMVTPDGMPIVWAQRLLGARSAHRVDGAGLTVGLLAEAQRRRLPVATYGGTEASAEGFARFLRREFPGVNLCAQLLPPFRPLDEAEQQEYLRQLQQAGARLVLVSMGCPKQERWMAAHCRELSAVLVGVGAALDFHAGIVRRAPLWMQRAGLEWFYRLCQEPRRLWRRYLYHNPRFLLRLGRQLLRGDSGRQSPGPVWRYPQSFWIYHRHLRRSQQLSAEQLRARQLRQLQTLLADAARHVPYYRELFARRRLSPGDFRELTDLAQLPILTKQQVRDNPYQFLHDQTHPQRLITDHTSGSTGSPLEFYLTPEQKAWDMACAIRFWHWAGYRTGARIAAFRHYLPATPNDPPFRHAPHSNTLFFSVFDMTPANLGRYVAEFNRFRPQFVRGYPSSIYSFAQFAAAEGLALHAPRAVLSSSETLAPEMRALIERVLQCPVFDWWGSNERLVTACQCEQRGLYHVNAEAGILELVPDPTQPDSSYRRLVATGLINRAMPLIRYDLGDLAEPASAACPCGRGLPTFARVLGRADDLIVTGTGKRVPAVRFYTLFETHTAIRQFQVVQTAPDDFTVRLAGVRAAGPDLVAKLQRLLGEGVRVQFEFVEAIAPTSSGKIRNVISQSRS